MPRPPKYFMSLREAANLVQSVIMTDPDRTWRYSEVRGQLKKIPGKSASWADATTARGFGYLEEDGIVVKESKGRYRLASKTWFRFFYLERVLQGAKQAVERGEASVRDWDGRSVAGEFNVNVVSVTLGGRQRESDEFDIGPELLFDLTEHLARKPEGSVVLAYSYRLNLKDLLSGPVASSRRSKPKGDRTR